MQNGRDTWLLLPYTHTPEAPLEAGAGPGKRDAVLAGGLGGDGHLVSVAGNLTNSGGAGEATESERSGER